MKRTCINQCGEIIEDMQPYEDAFEDCDFTCSSRYQSALNFKDFGLVVLMSSDFKSIGYCSFWIYSSNDFDSKGGSLVNFQIDYIYIRENFRGKGLSYLMAPIVCRDFLEFIQSVTGFKHFNDSSDYISKGGYNFGNRVFSLINS